jgi:hypothetical protein
MPTVYRTSAVSSGNGRNGHIRTDDGELELVTPVAQGGRAEPRTRSSCSPPATPAASTRRSKRPLATQASPSPTPPSPCPSP